MPLVPAFTITQSALLPGSITAQDTSTGSDAAITQRRIYFQTNTGTYLVSSGNSNSYEAWPYASASATFAVLTQDQALSIKVDWLDVNNTVLYTLTQVFCLPQYLKNFIYYLVQLQRLSPENLQNANYFASMAALWMNITGAIQAVEIGADINASQGCLDRATYMKNNENAFFT